jgi:hypothetical protein
MMDGQIVRCGGASGACVGSPHAVARLRAAAFFSLAGLALAGFARAGLAAVEAG